MTDPNPPVPPIADIGEPITNADQAIEAAARTAECWNMGEYPSHEIAARIRSLKDQVASPSDGAGVTARELLAAECDLDGLTKDSSDIRAGIKVSDAYDCALRAIEAALRPQPDLRAMLEKLSKLANGVAFRIAYYGARIDDSVLRENVKRIARETRALADEIDRALSDGASL